MYVTCKCLNVSIKTQDKVLSLIDIDDIKLNAHERADVFFSNQIASTKKLENIMKEQPGLVEIRNVGVWAIHRCYNCEMYTHAVHRKYGAAFVLINTNVIVDEIEIENLKASSNYSSVFRIVINQSDINDLSPLEPPTKFSVSQLSGHLKLALRGLEQQLEEAIQQKAHLIDQKIRAFTREQYQILEEFRERVHTEHTILARLICSEQQLAAESTNSETLPPTSETNQLNKSTSINDVVDATAHFPSNITIHQNSPSKESKGICTVNGDSDTDTQARKLSSYDGEALFMLEDMDDIPLAIRQLQASYQDSDSEDSGNEGLHVPRSQRGCHPTLAKSLPVTVPTFHSYSYRSIHDDDEEQISRDPMDPNSIQASIKALAKSVHGDTVFGDLPRPRFSTQI